MKNIFRVPVDNQHFKDTIENGKPLGDVESFLTGEARAQVHRVAVDGFVRYWGSIPGDSNRRNFEKLEEGDEILCYRSGKYIALAKFAFKQINRDLALHSWGQTETGFTWELVYFFNDVKFFEIDSTTVNKEFEYADGPVMGFSAISDEKTNEFLKKHDSVENFVKAYGLEGKISERISKEISELKINSPFEAQFYLVDLGNQLEFDTYVPASDSGHEVFGKKLDELITVRKVDLTEIFGSKILNPLSNIDVVWFRKNYTPKYLFEVIHSTGLPEAFGRLQAITEHFDTAKARIVGSKEKEVEFEKSRRLHFPNSVQISYKLYGDLMKVHSETLLFNKLKNEFLQ